MDNNVGLLYIVKIAGAHNNVLSDIGKGMWYYLLLKEITITVYLTEIWIKKQTSSGCLWRNQTNGN